MLEWLPLLVGVLGGTVLGVIFLVAVSVLIRRRQDAVAAQEDDLVLGEEIMTGPQSVSEVEPIRSYLEPDEDEPSTPLPSQSMAPLSFNRYVEVRGAIKGWTDSGLEVDAQLAMVFGLEAATYSEAHTWWMMALEGADDRLRDIDRRVAVFAERYGGTTQ